jgi:hypothetical protein
LSNLVNAAEAVRELFLEIFKEESETNTLPEGIEAAIAHLEYEVCNTPHAKEEFKKYKV